MAIATVREPDYIFLKDCGSHIMKGSKVYIEQSLSDMHPSYVVHLVGSQNKLFLIKPHIKSLIEGGYLTPSQSQNHTLKRRHYGKLLS